MTCCLFLSGTDSLFKEGGSVAVLLPAYCKRNYAPRFRHNQFFYSYCSYVMLQFLCKTKFNINFCCYLLIFLSYLPR